MRHSSKISLLVALFAAYSISFHYLSIERKHIIENEFIDYTMPSSFVRPLSLDYKGIVSDYLLFKFMAFIGGRLDSIQDYKSEYWGYTVEILDVITDLDPYFFDAYLYTEMFLTWQASNYEEAIRILKKGMKYIDDDYRIPYYIGFNYFYFLKDNVNSSKYIMEAAKIAPPSRYYLANLSARLSLYNDNHKIGIMFLEDLVKNTTNQWIRNEYIMRINTLKILDYLDAKVLEYKNKHQKAPESIKEIIDDGLIPDMPKDPYGGEFFILPNGRVYTTSNMIIKNYNSSK